MVDEIASMYRVLSNKVVYVIGRRPLGTTWYRYTEEVVGFKDGETARRFVADSFPQFANIEFEIILCYWLWEERPDYTAYATNPGEDEPITVRPLCDNCGGTGYIKRYDESGEDIFGGHQECELCDGTGLSFDERLAQ